jgi:hypothetical protein
MRPGHTDREKRERIREAALPFLGNVLASRELICFRITVRKGRKRKFDIENVLKPIIDAFCRGQIIRDQSAFPGVGLYDDDSLDHVPMLQVAGERSSDGVDSTVIEIFARKYGIPAG